MDASLLSQLLYKAKKDDKFVQLFSLSNNDVVIDPKNNWDIQADSLVTDDCVIDLNNISSAVIIDYQRYINVTQQVEKLNDKIQRGIL
ncbi:MAG: hypothetical protein J6M08_06190 [Methanobrevibacter sp.]|nr:hypothetical protein [Methanobrevibacter sp.]